MSVFKLVLCLTGLVIYLLVKQFIVVRPATNVLPSNPARQTVSPQPVQGQPENQNRSLKPQTTPHTEVLKTDREWI